MAINATSFINGYTGGGQALISEETRRKLIALGIDPSIITSEIQAKNLIEKVQCAVETGERIGCNHSENFSVNNLDYSVTEQNQDTILLTMTYNAELNKIILGL